MRSVVRGLASCLTAAALVTGCGGASEPEAPEGTAAGRAGAAEQMFPDVVEVQVTRDSEGIYSFDVTIASPYDTPERYADGWRILGPDEEVLGEMSLDHDHASEQPFTRTQSGVEIPDGVSSVTVEGRDLENGYGGGTRTVELPRS